MLFQPIDTSRLRLLGAFFALPVITVLLWTESIVKSVSWGIFAGVVLFSLVGKSPLWRWLWEKIPWFEPNVFPDLNGTWKAELQSTRPIVDARTQAVDAEPDKKKAVQATVRIHMDWLKLTVLLDTDDAYSSSETVSCSLLKRGKGRFELYYTYKNSTLNPQDSDESEHWGSARLTYEHNAGPGRTMSGAYWTNRGWQKGLNTAGTIRMTRQAPNSD